MEGITFARDKPIRVKTRDVEPEVQIAEDEGRVKSIRDVCQEVVNWVREHCIAPDAPSAMKRGSLGARKSSTDSSAWSTRINLGYSG